MPRRRNPSRAGCSVSGPPRVDFYLLSGQGPEERERVACRLAEKAWQLGHRVFIHTGTAFAANAMDNLLWTFRQDSFVPHSIDAGNTHAKEPILIGAGAAPAEDLDVLINLSDTVPGFAMVSERVAELIASDDDSKRAGRERYRHYRAQGCELLSHDI